MRMLHSQPLTRKDILEKRNKKVIFASTKIILLKRFFEIYLSEIAIFSQFFLYKKTRNSSNTLVQMGGEK